MTKNGHPQGGGFTTALFEWLPTVQQLMLKT